MGDVFQMNVVLILVIVFAVLLFSREGERGPKALGMLVVLGIVSFVFWFIVFAVIVANTA